MQVRYALLVLVLNFLLLVFLAGRTFHAWEENLLLLSPILEELKVLGFSFLTMLGMIFLTYKLPQNHRFRPRHQLMLGAMLTWIICAYPYLSYGSQIVRNLTIDRAEMSALNQKVRPIPETLNLTVGKGLTWDEYHFVEKRHQFPVLSTSAQNIDFSYQFDGFLPDYGLEISYDLPLGSDVKEFDYSEGQFLQRQSIDTLEGNLRVHYSEIRI